MAVWHLADGGLVVAIADGLGGMGGGDKAAELAIEFISSAVSGNRVNYDNILDIFMDIHLRIRKRQGESHVLSQMATTLTMGIFSREKVVGAHCGDTRVVMARGPGIIRLTRDHTEAQRYLDEGRITADEFVTYPRKNILSSALGSSKEPRIDIYSHNVLPGDRFIFSSDGVHGKVFLREIREIVETSLRPEDAMGEIRRLLHERRPNDNSSLVVVFRVE